MGRLVRILIARIIHRRRTPDNYWERIMQTEKRVVLTGATGLIGKRLTNELASRGYRVTVFSRNPEKARRTLPGTSEYVAWQHESTDWATHVTGAYAVINLAGAGIFSRRWTKSYKRRILESRVH